MAKPLFFGSERATPGVLSANYHTHTVRCGHASGTEREYIECAVSAGLQTLGFSDHAPYVFDGTHYSAFRMRPEELDHYVSTLLALREEYRDKIHLLIGLEAEYYPAHFEQFLSLLKPYPIDYLILGQHYLNNEYDGTPSLRPHEKEEELCRYVDQVTEGLKSKKFAYLAHPDVFHFTGDERIYHKHMSRLCEAAKQLDIPLEINFLGYSERRCYPSKRFFRIASEIGNKVIFGCDAHDPSMLQNRQAVAACTEMVEELKLTRTEQICLTLQNTL